MGFLPPNVSSFGHHIDSLFWIITIIVGVAFIIAEGIFLYFIIKYRKKDGVKAEYVAGNVWSQTKWVLIPLAIVIALDFFVDIKTHTAWSEIKGGLPQNQDLKIRITGQQFSWAYTLPGADGQLDTDDDIKKTGELHVPADTNIVFDLEAKDVLHSWFVPALRLKQDAVPGRTIRGWFKVTQPGSYEVMCAEICGVGHTIMKSTMIAHSKEEFAQWVANGGSDTAPGAGGADPFADMAKNLFASGAGDAEKGKALVTAKACMACHNLDGSKTVGPTYKGLFGSKRTVTAGGQDKEVVADEAYLLRSIYEPGAEVVKGYPPAMPPQKGLVSEQEAKDIIEYLKTVK
ncbi:MAG: cytochrome c oxidase subunit 2 [Oligoflexia bacterium]|nr:MAG: cytochrome c oxidase subunit 2 [Oligoflexia bacterium]